ncbi:hypothetical protein BH20ACT13_BH20ACT13_15130 [soil metagenome]
MVQSQAAKRPGRVSYLDTYFFFAGDDGGYAQYVENDSGRLVKMRADDGVHFERAAGDLIARKVLAHLNKRFDLTSWKRVDRERIRGLEDRQSGRGKGDDDRNLSRALAAGNARERPKGARPGCRDSGSARREQACRG